MTARQFPIFITVRDRLTCLVALLQWFERAGQHEIYLIDNASTYQPLREFLGGTSATVIVSERNLGHRAPWLTGEVQRRAHGKEYVVTDPDVIPDDDCPLDVLEYLSELLARHDSIHKVGLGLRIDDLPTAHPYIDTIRQWEQRFWADEVEPGVFSAPVDTTFALYRPLNRRAADHLALRTGAPHVARHLPWYLDPADLSDDERYYRQHADPAFSNWDRDAVPRWKQRWLADHPNAVD